MEGKRPLQSEVDFGLLEHVATEKRTTQATGFSDEPFGKRPGFSGRALVWTWAGVITAPKGCDIEQQNRTIPNSLMVAALASDLDCLPPWNWIATSRAFLDHDAIPVAVRQEDVSTAEFVAQPDITASESPQKIRCRTKPYSLYVWTTQSDLPAENVRTLQDAQIFLTLTKYEEANEFKVVI